MSRLQSAPKPTKDCEHRYPFCPNVTDYRKICKIGQGTFGVVFKAAHKTTNNLVALKKILIGPADDGFPITALREVKILQAIKHENVVHLIEVCHENEKSETKRDTIYFYMVFEFCEHDLAGLIKNKQLIFTPAAIKMAIKQLLGGLQVRYLHLNNIIHRDLKPSNILVTKNGVLKLADFGLSRALYTQSRRKYSPGVVTLWYRPPEVLLGDRYYNEAVDMWSFGCIVVEMWTRRPVFRGDKEQTQLKLIGELCGSICPAVWPEVQNLVMYKQLELPKRLLRQVKEGLRPWVRDPLALDLVDKLLVINPKWRIDSGRALDQDYFWTDPKPADLERIVSGLTQSNYQLGKCANVSVANPVHDVIY